jgi:hypothetical protein
LPILRSGLLKEANKVADAAFCVIPLQIAPEILPRSGPVSVLGLTILPVVHSIELAST